MLLSMVFAIHFAVGFALTAFLLIASE